MWIRCPRGIQRKARCNVWNAAQAANRFLITQDLDFSDIRKFMPGTHCGLLLIRLRAPGQTALSRRIESLFRAEAVDTWKRAVIIVTDHKLPIRRPAQ